MSRGGPSQTRIGLDIAKRVFQVHARQPEMRAVAVKTEEQQAVLALHAIRERLTKARTAAINQPHGLMGEFGVELPRGWRTMLPKAAAALDPVASAVPVLLRPQLSRQLEEVRSLRRCLENRRSSRDGTRVRISPSLPRTAMVCSLVLCAGPRGSSSSAAMSLIRRGHRVHAGFRTRIR